VCVNNFAEEKDMSCSDLHRRPPWGIRTTPHGSSQHTDYVFEIDPVSGEQFNGRVKDAVTGTVIGIVNGLCKANSANVTIMHCVISIPRTSIKLTGAVTKESEGSNRLVFNGSYTNLLDPGETGTGNGGQSGN
jgi:hypothetical protein